MGGQGQEYVPSLEVTTIGAMMMIDFRRRMTRGVGVILVPTLTTCRKLAMRLFSGGKKGVDHGKIVVVRGCLFCLIADDIGRTK